MVPRLRLQTVRPQDRRSRTGTGDHSGRATRGQRRIGLPENPRYRTGEPNGIQPDAQGRRRERFQRASLPHHQQSPGQRIGRKSEMISCNKTDLF